jgi:tripartite-type tricarboxylate transporter receptor subunit TctC
MSPWTRRRAAGALLASLAASPALAQGWPDRPLRLIAPYAPGGVTDILARGLGQGLERELGKPVVAENRPGANTIIGTQAAAGAAPDGLTLLLTSGAGFVVNPLVYRRLPYDPARDFSLLSVLTESALVMVVDARLPVRSVAEFIGFARGRGDGINYGTVGQGNPVQLATEMFGLMNGLRMTAVAYQGSAPAQLALAAGDVHVMFDALGSAFPLIRDGRLRALAVTTAERSAILPDVPTMMESGLPDYRAVAWFGIAVPRATPAPVQERLRAALAVAQSDEALRRRLGELGLLVQAPRDAAALASYVEEDRARWQAVIRERNLALDAP